MTETVYIVDDDAGLSLSLAMILESAGLRAKSYRNVDEFLEVADQDLKGCLLLDVRLPGTGGLEFQSQFSSTRSGLPIIIMTGYGDVAMTVKAMKAGAVDVLTKPFRESDLLDAVSAAMSLDRDRRVRQLADDRAVSLFQSLTPREHQIMELVAEGKLNKQIAFDLGISVVTVKIHRAAAMKKLKAKNMADFIRVSDRARSVTNSDEYEAIALADLHLFALRR